jgi:hypothetical protein
MLGDRFRRTRDIEIVSEQHFRIDHIGELHECARLAEVHVEREALLRGGFVGVAQVRIRERLGTQHEESRETRFTAGAAMGPDPVHRT